MLKNKTNKFLNVLLSLFLVLTFIIFLTGCVNNKNNDKKPNEEPLKKYSLAVPNGSPNIAVAGLTNLFAPNQVASEDGPNKIAPHFQKGEKDIIVAAVIQGAILANKLKDKFQYKLHGIVAKNNFYMASVSETKFNCESLKDKTIGIFGKNETPGALLNIIYKDHKNFIEHAAVKDMMVPILEGKVAAGIVAEPILTQLIAQAKASGQTVHFQALSELLPVDFGDIYQAGLFINKKITDQKEINSIKAAFIKNYESFKTNASDYLDNAYKAENRILNIANEKQLAVFKKAAPKMGITFDEMNKDNIVKVKAFLEFNARAINKPTKVDDTFFN